MSGVLFVLFYNKLKTVQSFSANLSPTLCKYFSFSGEERTGREEASRSGGCGPPACPKQQSLGFSFNICEPLELNGARSLGV